MNINLLKKSIQFSSDVVNIVKEYSVFMDKYFSDIKNQEKHKELYLAYSHFDGQIKDKAKQRGLVK